MKKYGFSLLEIIIVVMIISILATLGVPQFGRAVTKQRCRNAYVQLIAFHALNEVYKAQTGHYYGGNAGEAVGDDLDTINAAFGSHLQFHPDFYTPGNAFLSNYNAGPPQTYAANMTNVQECQFVLDQDAIEDGVNPSCVAVGFNACP